MAGILFKRAEFLLALVDSEFFSVHSWDEYIGLGGVAWLVLGYTI